MKKQILVGLVVLWALSLTGCSFFTSLGQGKLPDSFNMGDSIVITNDFELKMKSMEFTPKIVPDDPTTFYSSFEVDDPENTYFHTVFEVKNLRPSQEVADQIMTVTLLPENKTGYLCAAAVERNGDFYLSDDAVVFPLATDTIHYLTEVPLAMADAHKPAAVQITVNGHALTYPGDGSTGNSLINFSLGSVLPENDTWQEGTALAVEQPVEEAALGQLTLLETHFSNSVEPANKGSLYAVNGAKEQNRVYLDAVFTFENLAADSVAATEVLEALVIYDNKYEYRPFILVEQGGADANLLDAGMVAITPKATEKIHWVFEMPQELEKSAKPLVLALTYNEKDYYYQIR